MSVKEKVEQQEELILEEDITIFLPKLAQDVKVKEKLLDVFVMYAKDNCCYLVYNNLTLKLNLEQLVMHYLDIPTWEMKDFKVLQAM